ncbi:hypothetical protein MHH60_09195 [Paenibacillus sp. FSL H7-0716]|nr:hypothetical protein [Paenibacillus odorifer]
MAAKVCERLRIAVIARKRLQMPANSCEWPRMVANGCEWSQVAENSCE